MKWTCQNIKYILNILSSFPTFKPTMLNADVGYDPVNSALSKHAQRNQKSDTIRDSGAHIEGELIHIFRVTFLHSYHGAYHDDHVVAFELQTVADILVPDMYTVFLDLLVYDGIKYLKKKNFYDR